MRTLFSRKQFLALTGGSLAALIVGAPEELPSQTPTTRPPKGDPLPTELVKEWVGKAHKDLEGVKKLFAQEPRLLNASFDHGGGDFESALEAAGHVGNREIAEFLLSHGARMNVFCAAMLGELKLVKATLKAFPELKTSGGPHGLKLIHHAKKGGERAKAVLRYLESIGAE
jgi:hypothetical protein